MVFRKGSLGGLERSTFYPIHLAERSRPFWFDAIFFRKDVVFCLSAFSYT